MNPEVIDKSLKARIELFKMYIILIIGLVTGIVGLLFKEDNNTKLTLLSVGSIALSVILVFTFVSFFKINSRIKKLESLN